VLAEKRQGSLVFGTMMFLLLGFMSIIISRSFVHLLFCLVVIDISCR
jgi:hypothetical protein